MGIVGGRLTSRKFVDGARLENGRDNDFEVGLVDAPWFLLEMAPLQARNDCSGAIQCPQVVIHGTITNHSFF